MIGGGVSGARWTSAAVLRALFAAQCGLAVLVAAGDLSGSLLSMLAGSPSAAPEIGVPVTPGDQVRLFTPDRMPPGRPSAPGFPDDAGVPSRLAFDIVAMGERSRVLRLTGSIEPGDAARFADYLGRQSAPPDAIALHSPGGAVDEALEIGRAVRAAGLPVVVGEGDACFSACPYILAGGTLREVAGDARVGVHQHYFGENTFLPAFLAVSDVQAGQAEVMEYLIAMGVDPSLNIKGMMTPPDEIYILLPEELKQYRLVTE